MRRRNILFPQYPRLLLTLTALAFLAISCAPRVITSVPMKRRVAPLKELPRGARVPATQRPYRIKGRTYYPLPSAHGYVETGIASWYGRKFHGRKTSNGETYSMYKMTAAHKTLPMNTYLVVKNLDSGKEVTVRVNDRGPFVKGRIIDLSYGAAKRLGIAKQGTGRVRLTALGEAVSSRENGRITKRFTRVQDFEHGDFYVQIGSFKSKTNADRLKDQLIRWGKKTVVKQYSQGDEVFFRVQVRGGTMLEHAKRMERVLNKAGFPGAFVVAR